MSTTGAAPTTFGFARVLRAIVIAGAVAGPIDIGSASLINWAAPDRVARFIARGLIGDAAKTGGAGAAVLGLALQVFMAIIFAAIYVAAGSRAPILLRRPILCGIPFGAGVFCVMRFIVVPLSLAPSKITLNLPLALDFAANCMFGAIIAVIVSRLLRASSR